MHYAFFFFLYILFSGTAFASDMVIGDEIIYRVVKGDSIELISSKLGVDKKKIIRDNNLDIKKTLKVGLELKVNTRKIPPKILEDGIIVNIPDRMLYYYKDGLLLRAFPVGLGMPSWKGITRWRTPIGKFKIIGKRKNPTWDVPESIQWKMQMEGKPVKTIVPPGPDNPLGRYAIDTSIPRVVIHETIWPTTVYQFRSHGCIRVLGENIERLFNEVQIGTTGEIIYNPVKLAVLENGDIFLEVNGDIYQIYKDLRELTKELIKGRGIEDKVDWDKVELLIKEKSGIAEKINIQTK